MKHKHWISLVYSNLSLPQFDTLWNIFLVFHDISLHFCSIHFSLLHSSFLALSIFPPPQMHMFSVLIFSGGETCNFLLFCMNTLFKNQWCYKYYLFWLNIFVPSFIAGIQKLIILLQVWVLWVQHIVWIMDFPVNSNITHQHSLLFNKMDFIVDYIFVSNRNVY